MRGGAPACTAPSAGAAVGSGGRDVTGDGGGAGLDGDITGRAGARGGVGGGPGATAGAGAGIDSTCPHFGQATVWAAALSATLKCVAHFGQAKTGIGSPSASSGWKAIITAPAASARKDGLVC